jgi:hypothetical protein
MTTMLETAFAEAAKLSPQEQDVFAAEHVYTLGPIYERTSKCSLSTKIALLRSLLPILL